MKKSVFGFCISLILLSGSVFVAEADDVIEPIKKADFLKEQRALFNKADQNFDGNVSQDEISLLNDALNKPKYLKAFKELDTDSNGFLSLREIETKHQEFTESRIEKLSQSRESLLRRYDQDRDGNITARELDALEESKVKTIEASTPVLAATDLKTKDTDASGSVSLDEYLSSKTTASLIKARQSRRKGELIGRDKDGDRLITRSENEAYLERVFNGLDVNKDDQLSASEQSNRAFTTTQRVSLNSTYFSFDLTPKAN